MQKTKRVLRYLVFLLLLFMLVGTVLVKASAPDALSQGVCAKVINSNGSGGLAVRLHPSTSSTLLRRIPDGTVIRITGTSISFGGYTWWPHDGAGGRNNSGWSASNGLQETSCGSKPAYTASNQLSQEVQLYGGNWVLASRLTGHSYLKWFNSYYGRPGQFPLAAAVTSKPGMRTANLYNAVIRQFAVGSNPRYFPYQGNTFCNTYAGDVMRAMGVPLPVKSSNDPATITTGPLHTWLVQGNGWIQVNPRTPTGLTALINYVNAGKPALAITTGHVVVILPQSPPTNYLDLHVAQAGAENHNDILLRSAWSSSSSWSSIKFFVHE